MSRRAQRVAVALALLAIALPVLVLRGGDEGDPTAAEIADAVEATEACRSADVREVDNIGGPGLPDGMRAAREVACGTQRVVIHYVFDDDAAARGWLRDNGYVESPRSFRWRMRDGTLVGVVALNQEQWEAVLERVGL